MLPPGKICVLYGRVSTPTQNIHSQRDIGLAKAKQLGFQEQEVKVILDEGISSRAVKFENRQGISYVQQLVRENRVGILIVYDRDRIARDMIEYLEFIDDLIKFDVKVHFSNPSVEQFTRNFSREAELALDAEKEGNTIIARIQQAGKYYLTAPFGYKKVGKKSTTKYEFSSQEEIELIKSLFHEFDSIETKEEYQRLKKRWKETIPNLEKTLSHPYYAGHTYGDYGIEKLHHIEEIVSLEVIQRNTEKLKRWGYGKKQPPPQLSLLEQTEIPVVCDICGDTLKRSTIKSQLHFVCKHQQIESKTKAVRLAENRLLEIINQNLTEQLSKIDVDLLEEKCLTSINNVLVKLQKSKAKLVDHYNKLASVTLHNRNHLKKLQTNLTEIAAIKKQILLLDQERDQLTNLKGELSHFTNDVMKNIEREILSYSIVTMRTIITRILVGNDCVIVSNRFSDFQKGAG